MNYEVNPFISSQKDAIEEIKMITELYDRKKISASLFEELIITFLKLHLELIVEHVSDDLVKIKATTKQKIGKKRIRLIVKCISRSEIAELIDKNNYIFKIFKKAV